MNINNTKTDKMERTKGSKEFEAVKRSYATLYSICQYIPNCKSILQNYLDENEYDNPLIPGYYEQWPELTEEMDLLSKQAFNKWLSVESPEIIVQTLLPIRLTEKHRPFLMALKALADSEYKFYLESDNCNISRNFAAPSPFFVLPNTIEFVYLSKTIVIPYGEGTMEIDGMVMKAEDCQLLYSLMEVAHSRLKRSDEYGIHFSINIVDLAKARQKSNPWALSTQQAIRNGLKRLRGCVLTYDNGKGQWMIGGILNKATKIDDNEIKIILDRDYIDLLEMGYVDLNPDVYLKLPPLEANLYKYLRLQATFRNDKTLSKRINRKLYEVAGLGGIDSKSRTDSYIKRKLTTALRNLQRKGEVDQFSVDLKYTTLWKSDSRTEKKSIKSKELTRTKSSTIQTDTKKINIVKGTCPGGYRFGIDTEKFEPCDTCDVWGECVKAHDKSK
jgi:hypothetical protein